jgi:hypothetical protein
MSELKIIDLKLNNNYVQDLINNKPNLQDDKLLKINVLKNNLRNKIIGNQITKPAVIQHYTHTVNCKCNNEHTIKVEPENIYSKYYDIIIVVIVNVYIYSKMIYYLLVGEI